MRACSAWMRAAHSSRTAPEGSQYAMTLRSMLATYYRAPTCPPRGVAPAPRLATAETIHCESQTASVAIEGYNAGWERAHEWGLVLRDPPRWVIDRSPRPKETRCCLPCSRTSPSHRSRLLTLLILFASPTLPAPSPNRSSS